MRPGGSARSNAGAGGIEGGAQVDGGEMAMAVGRTVRDE